MTLQLTRGSAEDRRRRRAWLLETYRADVDLGRFEIARWDHSTPGSLDFAESTLWVYRPVPRGQGVPACRCYRCGCLLTIDTLTVDRIKPGALGGTYARNNIRPACSPCQTLTGNDLKAQLRARKLGTS